MEEVAVEGACCARFDVEACIPLSVDGGEGMSDVAVVRGGESAIREAVGFPSECAFVWTSADAEYELVATETVEVVGTGHLFRMELLVSVVIIHGAGGSTSCVACVGVKITHTGPGGSVINDGGVGTS